ncbi:MAG: glycosyltransferase family 4 protein [Muribaculaceae bacterium]|nr:glycosyltransferase family 4 protein [Muribaculaceae bacterium]
MINVFHIVSGKTWGGAEQYAYDLVSKMRHDERFYVEVVCKKNKAVLDEFRKLEVPVSILPLKGLRDLDSPMRFARQLRKGHNIVHVHTFHDAFLAVWARRVSENRNTTIIMTVHGIYHPHNNYLYRKIYDSIDHLVFTSQLSQDEFIGRARKLDVTKSSVIRDSVRPNELLSDVPVDNLRSKLGMKPEQVLIMYHGRLSHDKGIDVLLDAVKPLNKDSYRMVVMGEGSRKFTTQLKGFIVANNLVRNITLMGFCDNITKYISQCDMGVLPSTAPEALGIANLEYMMQGKPHISTNNGAQLEYVVNGKNALLVSPNNTSELTAAIKMLIDEPATRQSLGSQAQEDFNTKLNYDIFYNNITELYFKLNPTIRE